jgi:hypothetical protein
MSSSRSAVARTLRGLALALAAVASLGAPTALGAADPRAPTADSVADHLLHALGGQAAWDGTHYLKWTFAGRRTHWWDKYTGRHRVEGATKEGQKYVVLDNLNTHEGRAWVDGKEVTGDEAKPWLERGYGTWVNDSYWLLMPYKVRDPGVHLEYAGEESIDGHIYDKLALSFGQVGLTPGDRYWAYVNRDTGLMDRWAYILQDMPKDGPPTVWKWEGWERYGAMMLAPHRVQVGGDGKLELSDIAAPAELPDTVFTSNAPVS